MKSNRPKMTFSEIEKLNELVVSYKSTQLKLSSLIENGCYVFNERIRNQTIDILGGYLIKAFEAELADIVAQLEAEGVELPGVE